MAMLDLAAAASQAWLPMLVGTYTDTDSKGIYQYLFNQESGTAELTAVTPARNPSFVIFSENGDNVYAVDESGTDDDALAAFRYEGIDKPLTRINTVATGGKAPCNIFQTKNLIYTANYTGGSITEFRLADDGSIKKANKVMTYEWRAFACDLGNDCIYSLKPNAACDGLEVDSTLYVAAGSGPRHLTFDDEGRYAYLITELSGEVMVFSHHEGKLTQIQTITADDSHARGSADIHLTPDGRFLYASNRLQGDGIAIFSVDKESGMLTRAGYQPTARHTRNFAITPKCLQSTPTPVCSPTPATTSTCPTPCV